MLKIPFNQIIMTEQSTLLANHVTAFLNTNFTTADDLGIESITRILQQKRDEREVLKTNMQNTTAVTTQTLISSLRNAKERLVDLNKLQSLQNDVEGDLASYLLETAPISAGMGLLDELSGLQDRIEKLERAKGVLKVQVVVEQLNQQAKSLVQTSPQKALLPYTQLTKLIQVVHEQSNGTEETYVRLLFYLEKNRSNLWAELKTELIKKFEDTLVTLDWPNALNLSYDPSTQKLEAFKHAFADLLLLQQPVETPLSAKEIQKGRPLPALIPIEVMLQPLVIRFRYHFEGRQPTNRIDKPEWYLTHTLNLLKSHTHLFTSIVQPLLSNNPSEHIQSYIAIHEFVRGLIGLVSHKLTHDFPTLLQMPVELSHTVQEIIRFDVAIREAVGYRVPGMKGIWEGVAGEVICRNIQWAEGWIETEKTFAQARYHEVMSSEDAWEVILDDQIEGFVHSEDLLESRGGGNTNDKNVVRPTKSAIKLMDLLENVTDRYRGLLPFGPRMRFFLSIQIDLLETYHARISSAVDAFETMSLVKQVPVPGALPDAVVGTRGSSMDSLKRLAKWWGSAGWCKAIIKEWGEDEYFLEMEHEAGVRTRRQRRYKVKLAQNSKSQSNFRGRSPSPTTLTYESEFEDNEEYENNQEDEEEPTKAIFDETIELFQMLCERIEKVMVKVITREWGIGARAYSKKRDWSLSSSTTSNEQLLSEELYMPLSDFASSLTYLHALLPHRTFLVVFKQVSTDIEDWFWKQILMKNEFSRIGVAMLRTDIESGILAAGMRFVARPERVGKGKLRDALTLLELPSQEEEGASSMNTTLDTILSLLRRTGDGYEEELKRTLDEVGIIRLSEKEVREVLSRRLDVKGLVGIWLGDYARDLIWS